MSATLPSKGALRAIENSAPGTPSANDLLAHNLEQNH
jgi:hypothetical protein